MLRHPERVGAALGAARWRRHAVPRRACSRRSPSGVPSPKRYVSARSSDPPSTSGIRCRPRRHRVLPQGPGAPHCDSPGPCAPESPASSPSPAPGRTALQQQHGGRQWHRPRDRRSPRVMKSRRSSWTCSTINVHRYDSLSSALYPPV